MVYAIIKEINGAFAVHEEGFTDKGTAIKRWHHLCEALWAAPDLEFAVAKLVDENLDSVEGSKYTETIDKRTTPETPVVGE